MRLLVATFLVVGSVLFTSATGLCENLFEDGPSKIIKIHGKAVFYDRRTKQDIAATTDTIMFQNTKCTSCYVAAIPDTEGNYKVLVGPGTYRLIVNNPSSREDLLVKDQVRIVDVSNENDVKQVVELNIRMKESE